MICFLDAEAPAHVLDLLVYFPLGLCVAFIRKIYKSFVDAMYHVTAHELFKTPKLTEINRKNQK